MKEKSRVPNRNSKSISKVAKRKKKITGNVLACSMELVNGT